MKVEKSLNVTFNESHPPSKTSPFDDDELVKEEGINFHKNVDLGNNAKSETLEIDDIVNIKKSKNHPLHNVIRSLNQRTLRSQAQDKRNFFCCISTIEPKNVGEAIKEEIRVVSMQKALNQFTANEVWDLVPTTKN
ncbi:hypothetical protein Tco_0332009 [Tanacetum coccineum]